MVLNSIEWIGLTVLEIVILIIVPVISYIIWDKYYNPETIAHNKQKQLEKQQKWHT